MPYLISLYFSFSIRFLREIVALSVALTSTGKHAFEFNMMKDYCAEEGEDELFSIIISQQ